MLNLQEPKGKILFIAGFTIVHILTTVLFFFVSFSFVMAHADDNLPLPKLGEVLLLISDILLWPLIKAFTNEIFIDVSFSPGLMISALFLNSLLWALAALGIIFLFTRARQNKQLSRNR